MPTFSPTLSLQLETVSPLFLNGADTRQPELRAASVRGQLRYWLRAMIGAQTDNLAKVWEYESAVFGSTGCGSAVSVRLYRKGDLKVRNYEMLPHKDNPKQRSPQPAIAPGMCAELQLVTRPGVTMPPHAMLAFELWTLLGGIGKRSRRMFGAFSLSGSQFSTPDTLDNYIATLKTTLNKVSFDLNLYKSSIPSFPTLHPKHAWIIVGRYGFDDDRDAMIHLFRDLLRTDFFRKKEKTFGSASPRRSSTLIAQVRRIGDKYYPILTAIRSKPDQNIDWEHLKKFMETAAQKSHFDAEKVWGGW
jgi:CRISPR type III-B/RAMP module RAMP protein Cmr1